MISSPSGGVENGLGGSSAVSGPRSATVLPAREREGVGVSKNGSLGARECLSASVVVHIVVGFCFLAGSGWDRERPCREDMPMCASKLIPEEGRVDDWTSSNPRT